MTAGRLVTLALAVALAPAGPAWAACTVRDTGPTALGTYSPAALRKAAAPAAQTPGGFDCPDPLLVLLGGNQLSVTATSSTGFRLTSTTTEDSAGYSVAADAAGSNGFVPGTPFVYMNGSIINLLGLLGGSTRNVQVYVKPSAAGPVAPGIYTGSFQLAWEWKICTLIVLGLCGEYDTSARTGALKVSTVAVTMVVEARDLGVAITTRTTWDPLSSPGNPRAIPGSRQRTTVTLTNPDIVPLDTGSLSIVIPTPARGRVALDGDGTGSGAFVATSDGTPASSLAVTYAGAGSTSDDVDFSSDNGLDWTYDPTMAPNAVTSIRIRPRGAMAPGSRFSVSLPYALF